MKSIIDAREENEIESFFTDLATAQLVRAFAKITVSVAPARAPRKRWGSEVSQLVQTAVKKRIPAVIWKMRLHSLHDIERDLFQAFFVVAEEIGLFWFQPDYRYGQYITLLLYEAGNRIVRDMPQKLMLDYDEVDPSIISITVIQNDDKTSDEFEHESADQSPACDPIETIEHVKVVLESLSTTLRRTAERVWFDGQSIETVANGDNVTPEAISGRLHRVRQVLSERLKIPIRLRSRRRGRKPHRRNKRAR